MTLSMLKEADRWHCFYGYTKAEREAKIQSSQEKADCSGLTPTERRKAMEMTLFPCTGRVGRPLEYITYHLHRALLANKFGQLLLALPDLIIARGDKSVFGGLRKATQGLLRREKLGFDLLLKPGNLALCVLHGKSLSYHTNIILVSAFQRTICLVAMEPTFRFGGDGCARSTTRTTW
jgi:hypothetical protein